MSHHSIDVIYNEGERLIPGETHNSNEVIRHKSSYALFRTLIEADIMSAPGMLKRPITILDVGCGVGHGSHLLSSIINARVTGIEPDEASVKYARDEYGAANIEYIHADLASFVPNAGSFDYVVTRHALEHIRDGLELILQIPCNQRLMINVPYNEPPGNPHHLVNWITEKSFSAYSNPQFYYEDRRGMTFDRLDSPSDVNSIVCIQTISSTLPDARAQLKCPVPAWKPGALEKRGLESKQVELVYKSLANLAPQGDLMQSGDRFDALRDVLLGEIRTLSREIERVEKSVTESCKELLHKETRPLESKLEKLDRKFSEFRDRPTGLRRIRKNVRHLIDQVLGNRKVS